MKKLKGKRTEFVMSLSNFQEDTRVLENKNYKGDYFCITFHAPTISPSVTPGQFVHLRLPNSPDLLLRRPFSIYDVDTELSTLSLIYKVIGKGSKALSQVSAGTTVNLLGPLGNGFPPANKEKSIIIVAGGYGCASTFLVAKTAVNPGCCILGARTRDDILVENEFKQTGFKVNITTNDGSYGHKGIVTGVLQQKLNGLPYNQSASIYACGPDAMLKAVGRLALKHHAESYLSFDMPMCCGVGACFTCVIKIKADNNDGWEYVRTCYNGPVFEANDVFFE